MKDDLVERAREIGANAYVKAGNPLVAKLMRSGKADHMPGFIAALDVLAIARPAILEEAAQYIRGDGFDSSIRLDPQKHASLSDWFRDQQAAGIRALAHTTGQEPAPTCPICAEPFKADDICATDINEGTCHAECLEGSPVVDLDTGEASDGPVDTFIYGQEGGR